MKETLGIAALAICIASVIILWSVNNKRNREEVNRLESEYQMDLNGDSVIVKDKGRKVGTVHYSKLDSLICGDNQ